MNLNREINIRKLQYHLKAENEFLGEMMCQLTHGCQVTDVGAWIGTKSLILLTIQSSDSKHFAKTNSGEDLK